MPSPEENYVLTAVDRGTPGGDLMRRYWQPFLPAAKLEEDPVQPVRLMGEDLICYRDLNGKIGLIGSHCAHRGAGLRFGIPDISGLRCPYHGWCYDLEGQCVDTPLEAPNSRLRDHIKIAAYPVQELGGLLFAYLGPAPAPLLPPWDLFVWPNAFRHIGYSVIPCNWFQCQENSFDPVHTVYLHGDFFKYVLQRRGLMESRVHDETIHRAFTSQLTTVGYERVVTEYNRFGLQKGLSYSRKRGASADVIRWSNYTLFPNYVRPSSRFRKEFQIRVPIDNTHTLHICYVTYLAPEGVEVPHQNRIPCYEIPLFDDDGRPILDFVLAQDMAAWWSQGPIFDRTDEHLGGTDHAIREFRKLFRREVETANSGGDPMNVFRDAEEFGGDVLWVIPPAEEMERKGDLIKVMSAREEIDYLQDDHDRYSPVVDDIVALKKRIREYEELSPEGTLMSRA